jgi:TonB-dependent SusC/RagA subfamily outer membrane receptor
MRRMTSTLLCCIFFLSTFIHVAFCQDTSSLMTIKNDSVGIQLESMTIGVNVVGNIATTTVQMTFYNTVDRVLEGELNFPLADGQTVFRFAMDVNGKMREGVMVDKDKGRRVFERIVRQGIDPGLLEMTKGNNYKTRVYPIPANGRKSIVIGYEEELAATGDAVYSMAMRYGFIHNFQLNIEVFNQAIEPKLIKNDLVNFRFERWHSAFKASYKATNFIGNKSLRFAIPQKAEERIFFQQTPGNNFFYVTCNPEISERRKTLPQSVLILWDVSLSAAHRDLEKELTVLERYLNNFTAVAVQLITFSNTIVSNEHFTINNGKSDVLRKQLRSAVTDGATNIGCLDLNHLKADEALLFSDGIFNLGKNHLLPPAYPVYAINSNPVGDHNELKNIAQASGGMYINLLSKSIEEGEALLLNNQFQFISASYSKSLSEVYPSQPQPVSGTFSIAGKLSGQQASITLNFGIGKEITYSKTILIQPQTETTSTNVSRLWAHKKIDQLNASPEANREAITQTATQYSIVTPLTSLIVLDRIEDYIQYEIRPPAELKDAYDKLMREHKERERASREDILKSSFEDYKKQIAWWINNKKDAVVEGQAQQRLQQIESREVPQQAAPQPQRDVPVQQRSEVTSEPRLIISNHPDYNRVIRGKVTADDGSGIPGVNVLLKGTSVGTVTDVGGMYELNVPDEGGVLTFSFIGYATHEEAVQERSVVNQQMKPDIQELSEIVVVTGAERESRAMGYATTTVMGDALQGRVGGVSIDNDSQPQVMIRGNTSLNLGNNPLYIIDGKPATPEEAAKLQGPDIGNINVIKGENATALYGSRASDGVIVIMSKAAVADDLVLPDSVTEKFERGIIVAKEWNPEASYLDSLKATPKEKRYDVYQQLRKQYENTPAFFLIVGNFFVAEGESLIGLRILSNIAEMELENHELLKVLAYRFTQLGETSLAIGLLQKTVILRGNEPQSYRDLALAYEKNGDYQLALKNFLHIIFMDGEQNNWDDRFPMIKNIVIDEMNNLIRKHSKTLDLSQVPKELIKVMPIDIRIVLDWNALETDIDLWITEPNGEQCYYKNPLTRLGGRISEDFTNGYGPEVYQLKQALPGTYNVSVDFFDTRVQKISGPVTLQVTLYTYYGTTREQKRQLTVQLDAKEKKSLPVAELVFEKKK